MKPVKFFKTIFLFILFIFIFPACSQNQQSHEITVSILPQKYFLQRIAGSKFRINVMIPPGHNEAAYEPAPLQINGILNSQAYLLTGYIPFENSWINKLSSVNSKMIFFDTSKGVKTIDSGHNHSDNHKTGVHGTDPHIWLSPARVKIIAGNILEALCVIDSSNSDFFTENYNRFINDIDSLDNYIRQQTKNLTGKKFIIFHPSLTYFAADYGLTQIAIEAEGKEPSASYIKEIITTAGKNNIRTVFIQKQFPASYAESIAKDIKGKIVTIDPLAEDWLENIKTIAAAFSQELK